MTSELSFQFSFSEIFYAIFDGIISVFLRISVDRYDQTLCCMFPHQRSIAGGGYFE